MDADHPHDATHANHARHLNPYILAAVGAASAVMLAPYVLPLLGIGEAGMATRLMHSIGGMEGYGTGLAGALSTGIAHVPLIGAALTSATPVTIPLTGWTVAAGTLTTIAATAVIGIGGVLLANWLEKREQPDAPIHWSRVIRYTALTSSALISLPGILSGISMGIAFLALVIGGYGLAGKTILGLQSTLGSNAMTGETASGIVGMIMPHLLSCGTALLPLLGGFFLGTHATPARPTVAAREKTETMITCVAMDPIIRGQPCHLAFRLVDKVSGKPLAPQDLDTIHTKKLHTMIVDHALTDYHHLHPEYDAKSGLFLASFTPNLQQPYRVWNDFTRVSDARSTALKTELPSATGYEIPPSIVHTHIASAGGLTMHVETAQPLEAGRASLVTLRVTDSAGNLVPDLEPIMGAYAHLAGFSKDGAHFIHCHPMGDEPQSEAERGNGILQFHIQPEWSGYTKFFLQVRHHGQDVTLPFGQYIQPQEKFTARPVENQHHGMALGWR